MLQFFKQLWKPIQAVGNFCSFYSCKKNKAVHLLTFPNIDNGGVEETRLQGKYLGPVEPGKKNADRGR